MSLCHIMLWGLGNHFSSELKVPAVTFQTVQYGWSQMTCFTQVLHVLAVLTIYCINIVTSFKLSYCVIFKRKRWLLEENLRSTFFNATFDTRTCLYFLLPQLTEFLMYVQLTCYVCLCQTIDALDSWEGLTELGHRLLDLPVEPRLGKMLLYSIVLKCLDPVLTIVCCLAYRLVNAALNIFQSKLCIVYCVLFVHSSIDPAS